MLALLLLCGDRLLGPPLFPLREVVGGGTTTALPNICCAGSMPLSVDDAVMLSSVADTARTHTGSWACAHSTKRQPGHFLAGPEYTAQPTTSWLTDVAKSTFPQHPEAQQDSAERSHKALPIQRLLGVTVRRAKHIAQRHPPWNLSLSHSIYACGILLLSHQPDSGTHAVITATVSVCKHACMTHQGA